MQNRLVDSKFLEAMLVNQSLRSQLPWLEDLAAAAPPPPHAGCSCGRQRQERKGLYFKIKQAIATASEADIDQIKSAMKCDQLSLNVQDLNDPSKITRVTR